jgi:2-dehydropantoate 2-reductase
MSDDLEHRRMTEIDQLQGAVVALASAQGLAAPVNRAVLELVQAAERAEVGSPRLDPAAIASRLPALR